MSKNYNEMSKDELYQELETVCDDISKTQSHLDELREKFDELHYCGKDYIREEYSKFKKQFILVEKDNYLCVCYVKDIDFIGFTNPEFETIGFTNYDDSLILNADINCYLGLDDISPDNIKIITKDKFFEVMNQLINEQKSKFIKKIDECKDNE